jgi:hypothetical protein
MTLADVFETTASAAASEQERLREVARCRENAQPILAVIEKIRASGSDADPGRFHVIEGSTMGGSFTLDIGLQNRNGTNDDEYTNWCDIPNHARRKITLHFDIDGHATAVRWDQMKPSRSVQPDGVSPTLTQCTSARAVVPVLAAWVQDNMPEAAKKLTAPPPQQVRSHGLCE